MIQNEKKISISVSNLNFSTKQETEKCYSKLVFTPSIVDLEEITSYINDGYALSHLFYNSSNSTFTTRQKKNDNFISSQLIAIDLDNCEYSTLSSLLNDIELVPSIAYTTLSHKTVDAEGKDKGNRYRLLYAFNEKITSVAEYRHMYNCVVSYLKQQIPTLEDDTKMVNPAQMFFGSSCSTDNVNKEVYNNNVVYNKSEFTKFRTTSKSDKKISTFKKVDDDVELVIINKNFMEDFNDKNIGNLKLVERYKSDYKWFESTPLPVVAETERYITLPSDYLKIKRYFKTENGRRTVLKLSNGKHRRNTLYINALLRRLMIPGITLDHLLYCLMTELTEYCINNFNDFINRKEIYLICVNALETDLEDEKVKEIAEGYRIKQKWVINEAYVQANHTTKEYVRNQVRKELNDIEIAKYFDVNLSIKANLEVMKNNGVNVSTRKLYNYRNELQGIEPKPRKEKVFKDVVIDVEVVDLPFGSSSSSEISELVKQHTNNNTSTIVNKQHISAHGAPQTNEVKEEKMENEEILIKEYLKISKEVIKQTENYRKKDIVIIVDSIKDYEYKFNRLLSKDDLDDLFDSLETNCLNIIKERIQDYYRRREYEYINKETILDFYVPNVTTEYQQDITDLINTLHTTHEARITA